jgi:hypothetical protein
VIDPPPEPHPSVLAVCHFYVREKAGGGTFTYTLMHLAAQQLDGALRAAQPPLVGDRIFLWDSAMKAGGSYQVIARQWGYSAYGSVNWPYNEMHPRVGPRLDIIVEAAAGVFRNEAPICGAEGCEAVIIDGEWWQPPGVNPGPHQHVPYQESEPRPQLPFGRNTTRPEGES